MPPKKKPEKKKEPDEEPAGYNVDVMTLDQLRQYAVSLQNEIEDMRKHCNFYQKMENELVELLRITEDDLRKREIGILDKDVELEEIKMKFLKHHEKGQWPEYMKHAGFERKENLSSQTDSHIEGEHIRHLKEKKRLKAILQEKDRQLEALRVKIEMARREAIEKNDSHLKELHDQQKSMFERAVDRFEAVKKETVAEFKLAKEVIVYDATEEKIRGEKSFNEVCDTLKQKLQSYYKDVTKKDLSTIKLLKQKIKKVEESISSSKRLLQEAQIENKYLRESAQPKFAKRTNHMAVKYDAGPLKIKEALKRHNRTEKLSIDNQRLEEQIKYVMERTCELRRHFTSALKKVRDATEKKPAILEEKLDFILSGKSHDSGPTETLHEKGNSECTISSDETLDTSES